MAETLMRGKIWNCLNSLLNCLKDCALTFSCNKLLAERRAPAGTLTAKERFNAWTWARHTDPAHRHRFGGGSGRGHRRRRLRARLDQQQQRTDAGRQWRFPELPRGV